MNRLNDWEQKLHDSLSDHATPPPADGWARLERELAVQDAALRRQRARRKAFRLGALAVTVSAAAAVLVAVFMPSASEQQNPAAPQMAETAPATNPKQGGAEVPSATETETYPAEEPLLAAAPQGEEEALSQTAFALAAAAPQGQAPAAQMMQRVASADAPEAVADLQEASAEGSAEAEMPAAKAPTQTDRADRALLYNNRNRAREESPSLASAAAPTKRGVAFAVSVEGTTAGNVTQSGYAYLPQVSSTMSDEGEQPAADNYSAVLLQNISQNVYSHIDHKLPLRLAFNVSVPLTDRLALETGLDYTYLRTDLQSGSADTYYATVQRLHYVGVPLHLNYSLYRSNAFDLYATAGGSFAKCVSGEWTTDYVVSGVAEGTSEHATVGRGLWQASLEAAAGVEARLSRRWGLFIEPGVTYYVKDGSTLPTLRHDHPLNFSLQLGLRWRIGKSGTP
ncbi:MAG: outer membrane beta-barrel protein [Bacteroidales bacterium]|nr:outer membrane beta-barrel protein [Bacteroidales bacterium]